MSDKPMQNTDRELWSTTEGDYYSKHKIYISESGNALTICEGGSCITRTVETWFALQSQPQAPEAGVDEAMDVAFVAVDKKMEERKETAPGSSIFPYVTTAVKALTAAGYLAKQAAPCPHVHTGKDGTSHCTLAEADGQRVRQLEAALRKAKVGLLASTPDYFDHEESDVEARRDYAEAVEAVNAALGQKEADNG